MPPTTDRLRLLNARTNQKEQLSPREPLRFYFPPVASRATPAQPTEWRIYCVAELLRRLLEREGRQVQLVGEPEQADLVVSGATEDGKGLLVTVIPPVAEDITEIEPGEARYLAHSMPHAGPLQWSNGALAGAKAALSRLKDYLTRLEGQPGGGSPGEVNDWRARFFAQLYDDLNTTRALAILWTMLQSNLPGGDKYALLSDFVRVFGLDEALGLPALPAPVAPAATNGHHPPGEALPSKKTDPLTGLQSGRPPKPASPPAKTKDKPKAAKPASEGAPARRRITRSQEVRSYLEQPDRFDFTVSLVAYDNLAQVKTTVESLAQFIPRSNRSVEVIAVEMSGQENIAEYLEMRAAQLANFRVVYAQPNLGEAAGRNVAFRQARGRFLVLLEAGVRLKADIFERLWPALSQTKEPILYGVYPVELKREGETISGFEPVSVPANAAPASAEALEGTLLILPRRALEEAGFMDEHFRLPYALDLDYSLGWRDKEFAITVLPWLAGLVEKPAQRSGPALAAEQLERQRQKNWQLFLRTWQS